MRENREASGVPEVKPYGRPVGEGESRTAHVHALEESDSGVVCAEQRVLLGRVQVPLALE